MNSTDADKLIAAARQATAERDRAREEAARLLTPDPVDVVANLLIELEMVRGDRDDGMEAVEVLTADLTAIHGMVGRPAVPIVDAVRQAFDDERAIKKDLRDKRDTALQYIGKIAVALGLSEYAPAAMVLDEITVARKRRDDAMEHLAGRRDEAVASLRDVAVAIGLSQHASPAAIRDQAKDLRAERDQLKERVDALVTSVQDRGQEIRSLCVAANDEVERLKAHLATAEADAETQRTAAADLRDALDRVATAAGFGPGGAAPDVADRVIAVIRAMQARPVLTVERLADALRAANVTLEPSTTALIAMSTMGTMSHMGDIVLPKTAALPADLRTYLETRRDRLQGGHGLAVAAEIAALNRWLALPTAEVSK